MQNVPLHHHPIDGIFRGKGGPEECKRCILEHSAPDLLEACNKIFKMHLCPEPKRMADWSARCDVMADYARKAIAKAEGR